MEEPEIIYKKYNKKIYNLAYRMTGNKDDASDITQDTFIQAFKSLENFRGDSQVYTWLYKIAKNNCLKLLKEKKKSSPASLQELIDNASSPVSEDICEADKTRYIEQVKDGCLSGLLRCLSLQQRLAFILNILLNMPIGQTAAVIGKSENAARILVHRAKQNIKSFLCQNCSLYDPKNKCRCENLINFSLKQGWIGLDNRSGATALAETEIKDLKNAAGLYKTLQEAVPDNSLSFKIRHLLDERKDFLILNTKKVK